MFKRLVISTLSPACWGTRTISASLLVQRNQQVVAAGRETLHIALRKSLRGLARALIAMIVLSTSLFGTVHGAGRGLALLPSQKTVQAAGETVSGVTSDQVIASGLADSCAINGGDYYGTPGLLYCWGSMFKYTGVGGRRSLPMNIFYGPDGYPDGGVTAVAAGFGHNCAIKDGALYCWGSNNYSQLGDGTMTNRYTPVAVRDMRSGVTAVTVGYGHTCAIKSGALYCWGRNYSGELGDGTRNNSSAPVAVQGMGSGVTAVDSGDEHTCAIKNGALYCWGNNLEGQIGDGTWVLYRSAPVAVTGMDSGVTAVSVGERNSCAVKSGALYCWGDNEEGQIGNGTIDQTLIRDPITMPVQVSYMSGGVTAVSTGRKHACAIRSGAVYCWGANYSGQLGNGTTTPRSLTPVPVSGLNSGMVAVSVSDAADSLAFPQAHVLALGSDGCLYGWGENFYFQVGSLQPSPVRTPVLVDTATVASGTCSWSKPGGNMQFTKSLPRRDAIGQPSSGLDMRWTSRSGADHYRYCVDVAPGCVPTVSTGINQKVTVNLSPGVYYWQVRACFNTDCSTFVDSNNGEQWSFSVSPYRAEIALSRDEIPANAIEFYGSLTVTLRTWDGQPLVRAPVQLHTSRPNADILAPARGETNRIGQFMLRIASSEHGTAVISVTSSLYPGVVLTRTTVRFTQPVSSTLSAGPRYTLVSTDAHSSTLRLRLLGSDGLPASNKTVAFFSSRSQDTIMPAVAQTNSGGEAEVRIRSVLSGTAVITVHNVSDNIAVPVSTSVMFVPTGVRSVVANVIAMPDTITVGMTTTLQAFVRDTATGAYYLSYPVYFVQEQGSGLLTHVDGHPATAQFQSTISGTVSGTVMVTAMDSLTRIPLGRTEVTVVSDCPRRPVILDFVPSMRLGPDVSYPQLSGQDAAAFVGFAIPLHSKITVDWGGCMPGKITFALANGNRVEKNVAEAQSKGVKAYHEVRSFDLVRQLPSGLTEMIVEAHSIGGVKSEPYRIPVQSAPLPTWLFLITSLADLPFAGNVPAPNQQYQPLLAIARIFPNPGGWKMVPMEVVSKQPNTQYTDDQGKARQDATELIKNHTTKIMLRVSGNLWLACDRPPKLMGQLFAKKNEIAHFGSFKLTGWMQGSLSVEPHVNPMCYFFINDAYYRKAKGSLGISTDVGLEFKEPLAVFIARFFPQVYGVYYAMCEENGVMSKISNVVGDFWVPGDKCDKFLADTLGEVYAIIALSLKASAKIGYDNGGFFMNEWSGDIGPKIAAGYEAAPFGGRLYVNSEVNGGFSFKLGSNQATSASESMPLTGIAAKVEAFLTLNFMNLYHYEPKWSYEYYWPLNNARLLSTSIMSDISTLTYDPKHISTSVISGLVPPASGEPTYAGFALPGRVQAFAQTQYPVAAQSGSVSSSSTITTILASGYLTYSETSLAHDAVGGRSLLVWTQDDPDRPLGGSREVMYSLWNGTGWSNPRAITSDEVHDLAPKVSWLGANTAIAVWTRMKERINETIDLSDAVSRMEIAYAIYDAANDRWSPVRSLTNDNSSDYGVELSRNAAGETLVAWVSINGDSSAIKAAFFGANGQVTRQVHTVQSESDQSAIVETAVGLGNNQAAIAYTKRIRAESDGPVVSKLYTTKWDAATGVWSIAEERQAVLRQQSDSHPSLTVDESGQVWLMFNRTGEQQTNQSGGGQADAAGYDKVNRLVLDNLSDAAGEQVLPMDGQSIMRLRLLHTQRGLMALLLAENAGQLDLYASVANSGHTDWSKPIRLLNDLASEMSVDAQVGSDGELLASYIRKNNEVVTNTTRIGDEVLTTTKRQPIGTDLVALSRVFSTLPDAAISSEGITVTFENDKPLPGTTALVSVTVANRGDALASPFSVKLYAGNPSVGGQLISETQISLAAGFTQTLQFVWSVPAADRIDLYVALDENNSLSESDETNNAASIEALGPAIQLDGIDAHVRDYDLVDVYSFISSVGSTTTTPALMTVTLSTITNEVVLTESTGIELMEPGEVVTEHTIISAAYLQSGVYSVTVALQTPTGEARDETTINLLPNLAFESESLDITDLTVPFIRVEGVVRNTSQFGVPDVLVAVFDPARTVATGLVATTTIPFIGPGETVPVSLIVPEAMPCGLSVWVNPYGLPGTFAEQQFSDNFLYKSGSERMCTRAGYEVNRRSGVAPLTVVLTGTFTPNTTSWEWDFGDGVAGLLSGTGVQSFTQVVSHTYTQPGVYTVTLRATSPYTSTFWQEPMTVRVYARAAADFESGNRSVLVGEVVSFTNRSTGDISNYSWDFGDGETSSSYEPLHEYERPGRYTVTLTVDGAGGTDTITRTEYIAVYATRAYFPSVARR